MGFTADRRSRFCSEALTPHFRMLHSVQIPDDKQQNFDWLKFMVPPSRIELLTPSLHDLRRTARSLMSREFGFCEIASVGWNS